jgi:hypothetical protein
MVRSIAWNLAGAVALFAVAGCKFGDNSGGSTYDGGFDGFAPQGPLLVATPASDDFGVVNVGSKSATKTVVVANVGPGTTGSLAVALSGSSDFVIDTDGCKEMALGTTGNCSVAVHFAPTTSGLRSASLQVSATPGGTAQVSLSGTGAGAGSLSITPATNDYGPVPVGSTSAPATFTVTNKGNTATGAVTVALSGSDAKQFAPSSDLCSGKPLAPLGSCTVAVIASPTSPGSKAATLTAQAAGESGTATASLSANALAGPTFVINPPSYGFGPVVEGSPPGTGTTFTVQNVGGADAGVPALAVTGPNAQDFAIATNMCTSGLGPMGMCTFALTFSPSTPAAESATVTASAANAMSGQASVTGTGLAPAALTITPSSQPFAPLVQGAMPSADVPFQVKNTGAVATGALAVSLAGTNADQFGLGMDGCTGQMLGAGGMCTVYVHFAPTTTGVAGGLQASLQVTGMPGGQTAATLTATSIAPAHLTVSPTTQPLGSALRGTVGGDFPLMVSNDGGDTTGAITVAISGTMMADFGPGMDGCTGQTLTKGASCTVYAHLNPGNNSRGNESATLTVSASPGGSVPVTLTGNVLAPAQLSLSGPTVPQWTNVGVYSTGAPVAFTVTNDGDLQSGTITYNLSTGSAPFAFPRSPPNTCTAALGPGQSCMFEADFTPQTAAGVTTGSLTATANPGGSTSATLEGSAQWVLEVSIYADPACGSPSGSVASIPAGMNCAVPTTPGNTNACLAQFADGTGVTLDFNGNSPDPPSGCTAVAGVQPVQCSFTMNAANPNPFVSVTYCGLIP